jgi:hypothetical protein
VTLIARASGRRLHLAATAVVAPVVLGFLLIGSASAYVGTNPFVVTFSGSGSVSCSANAVITATVRDAHNGKPVGFQTVQWSFKSTQSPRDRISASVTKTNNSGHTSVTISFGPVSGARKIVASAGGFANITGVACNAAVATASPKPAKTHRPTPKPPKTATQPTATAPTPYSQPTVKPKKHHQATPTPYGGQAGATTEPSVPDETQGAGGASVPSPTDLTPLESSSDLAVLGGAAATEQPAALAVSDRGSGGGFDSFGIIALLVIGALTVLVVIFLVRQPDRARARR